MMLRRVLLLLVLLSLVLSCASGSDALDTSRRPTAGMQPQPQPQPPAAQPPSQPPSQQPSSSSSSSGTSSSGTSSKIAAARATLATVSALWESLADAVEQIGEPWRRRGHDGLLDTLEALGGWRDRLTTAIAAAESPTADTNAADTAAGAARDPNVQAVINDAEAALADLEALTRGARR